MTDARNASATVVEIAAMIAKNANDAGFAADYCC